MFRHPSNVLLQQTPVSVIGLRGYAARRDANKTTRFECTASHRRAAFIDMLWVSRGMDLQCLSNKVLIITHFSPANSGSATRSCQPEDKFKIALPGASSWLGPASTLEV